MGERLCLSMRDENLPVRRAMLVLHKVTSKVSLSIFLIVHFVLTVSSLNESVYQIVYWLFSEVLFLHSKNSCMKKEMLME